MIYNLYNPWERDHFIAKVKKLLEGNGVVELTEKKPHRTLAQNNYLHLIISYFASEYGCSAEYAKQHFYKCVCNAELYVIDKVSNFGKEFKDVRSSSALTTDEMSLSIERFKNWSAQHGITLPDAEDKNFLVYALQEVERNKEFL